MKGDESDNKEKSQIFSVGRFSLHLHRDETEMLADYGYIKNFFLNRVASSGLEPNGYKLETAVVALLGSCSISRRQESHCGWEHVGIATLNCGRTQDHDTRPLGVALDPCMYRGILFQRAMQPLPCTTTRPKNLAAVAISFFFFVDLVRCYLV